ncbi:MAG TPA: cyanophycinase [Gemmatimonadaceae bacterium]|nr:cyanophycinase [Gemmatimonadaceae bacterium]
MRDGRSIVAEFRVTVALIALAAGACATAGRPLQPVATAPMVQSRGHLLLVGGGPIPPEITTRFVELAGGAGTARIAVLPMASAVASTGPDKASELRALGADAFSISFTRAGADTDSILRKLEAVTGIWFTGGDQNRLMETLAGSKAERAIRARHLAGAVVGGTSAGAAVMSSPMLTGSERRPGGARRLTDSTQAYVTIDRDNIVTAAGLGLLRGAIVDQHFVRRRRQNRLLSLVLEHPAMLGVGIDESTAIDVRPDGSWLVVGASVAVIFDARASEITPGGEVLGASGIRMHILPGGTTFDPVAGRVTRLGSGPR